MARPIKTLKEAIVSKISNGGSDVTVDDNLNLGSSNEIKNASAVSTESLNTDAIDRQTSFGDGTADYFLTATNSDNEGVNIGAQRTSVGTSATTIWSHDTNEIAGRGAQLMVVVGRPSDGSERFTDLVIGHIGGGDFSVVDSVETSGADTRSYSRSGFDYELAMGSETYEVTTSAVGAGLESS